ncbi:MAG: HU family DNA-binding protein, partial [bacterium]
TCNRLAFTKLPGGFVLTKGDIINIVAEGTGLTKLETGAVVDGFLATIGYALQTGDSVTIRGFGSFRTVQRRERISKNPKTGKMMHVPDRTAPVFKASIDLKKLVNENKIDLE